MTIFLSIHSNVSYVQHVTINYKWMPNLGIDYNIIYLNMYTCTIV